MTINVARLPVALPSSKIPEEDVSANRLASILVSAAIENEIDSDGDIYVTDGLEFPVWISVDADRRFLSFGALASVGNQTVERILIGSQMNLHHAHDANPNKGSRLVPTQHLNKK